MEPLGVVHAGKWTTEAVLVGMASGTISIFYFDSDGKGALKNKFVNIEKTQQW